MHGARGGAVTIYTPPHLISRGHVVPSSPLLYWHLSKQPKVIWSWGVPFCSTIDFLGWLLNWLKGHIPKRLWNEETSADRLCSLGGLKEVWGCFGGMSACHPLHGGAKAAGPEQGVILVIPRLLVTLLLLPPLVIISHDPKRNLSGLSSVVLPKGSEKK